jgi:lysophospholipase L1-like esterase
MSLRQSLRFWSTLPWVLPQALRVRKTAPRFAGAGGVDFGIALVDGSQADQNLVADTPDRHDFAANVGAEKRLLIFGDSVVAGVGASSHTLGLGGQCASAMAIALAQNIAWQAVGQIGIESTQLEARLWPKVPKDQRWDWVLISVGVNDITALTRRVRFYKALTKLLQQIRVRAPDAVVLFCGLPPVHGFPLLPKPLRTVFGMRARMLNQLLQKLARAHAHVLYLPVKFETHPEAFAADGFHPSEASYARFGKAAADIFLAHDQPPVA